MLTAPMSRPSLDALSLVRAVKNRTITARASCELVLDRIATEDDAYNCFTAVLSERALARADTIDAMIARGEDPGPLAGVPFGVKNLFDIEGLATIAGSKILANAAPATRDAALVTALEQAGAILVGALNMDEFAYGFSTENEHYGPTRNPHDTDRIAGGSSGGSAAAVAAGLLPLTLGTDTNGSVRVPASLCGIYGLKPSYGTLDRTGMYPFVDSLDHAGLFTRSIDEMEASFCALVGPRPGAEDKPQALRAAVLEGWFAQPAGEGVHEAVARVASALGDLPRVELPASDVARAAAFCMTAAEGAALHLERLRTRPMEFDIATRDRLIAGCTLPGPALEKAHTFRKWYREQARRLFEAHDILIAPATICPAPRIGEAEVSIDGKPVPVRANLGLFTQPISFIGLPVLTVPVTGTGSLPLGVQLIAAWGQEAKLFKAARALAAAGAIACPPVTPCADPAQVSPN